MTRTIFLLLMCSCVSGQQLFPQTCYPNGTVQVENPNPSLYVSVFAVQNEGYANAQICNATMDGVIITVTDCDISEEINIFLSDRPASDDATFVGGNWISYCVFCADISDSGVERTVSNILGASLPVTTQEAITPSFTVSSALRKSNPEGPVAISAQVGETLYWTIDFPSDYNGRPTCTAYSGTDRTGSPSKPLFNEGCNQDTDLLVSDFENVYSGIPGVNRLYVEFYAFKFYNGDDVFFECSVKLCPSSSTACDLPCNKRRRRAPVGRYIQGEEDGVIYRASNRLHIIAVVENSATHALVVEDFRQAGDLYILIVRSWREFELLSGRMRENQDKNAAAGDQASHSPLPTESSSHFPLIHHTYIRNGFNGKYLKDINHKNGEKLRLRLPPSPNGMLVHNPPEVHAPWFLYNFQKPEGNVEHNDAAHSKELNRIGKKSSKLAKEIFEKYNMKSDSQNTLPGKHIYNGFQQLSMPWRNKTFLTLPVRLNGSIRMKNAKYLDSDQISISSQNADFGSNVTVVSSETRSDFGDWQDGE